MIVTLESLKVHRQTCRGLSVKVKVQGKYRQGKILNVARTKDTNELLVSVKLDGLEMIQASPYLQIDWYKLARLRKADQQTIRNIFKEKDERDE